MKKNERISLSYKLSREILRLINKTIPGEMNDKDKLIVITDAIIFYIFFIKDNFDIDIKDIKKYVYFTFKKLNVSIDIAVDCEDVMLKNSSMSIIY